MATGFDEELLEKTSLDEAELNQAFHIILVAHGIDDPSNPAENEVTQGMTESSAWVHDQAAGLNSPTPTANELQNHLKFFESFFEKFK